MEIINFGQNPAKRVTHFGSDFLMTPVLHVVGSAQVSQMTLLPGGMVGLHQAVSAQLLIVIDGKGWVRTQESDPIFVSAGDGILWAAGERHETRTDSGLKALVFEAEQMTVPHDHPSD